MTLDNIVGWMSIMIVPLFVIAIGISIIEWMFKTAIKDFKKTFCRKKKEEDKK